MTSKSTVKYSDSAILYAFPTKVGPLDALEDGVKIGSTIQDMYGRQRAYSQLGIQISSTTWMGRGMSVDYIETLLKEALQPYSIARKYPNASCTEVFMLPFDQVKETIEILIIKHRLSIRFLHENYTCTNKSQHKRFLIDNPITFTLDDLEEDTIYSEFDFDVRLAPPTAGIEIHQHMVSIQKLKDHARTRYQPMDFADIFG